ncbi:MAG TPA: translocation/assembly module TamB domain-containing protein [Gammaproteobacteria bacterium]|nr:translocation/assembly module TamB domain-containing protein [Gammaproteobacteria bacterium]
MTLRRLARWLAPLARWLAPLARWLAPLALLAIFVGAGCAWLIGTASGTRLLVERVARSGVVELGYEGLEGSLAGGLVVDGLRLRLPSAALEVAQAKLRWQPLALLRGRLVVDRLELDRGALRVTPSTAPSAGATPGTPLPVHVETIELRELALVLPEQTHRLHHLRASLAADAAGIGLQVRALHLDTHHLSGRASLRAGQVDAALEYANEPGSDTALAATLRAAGPLAALRTELRLRAPLAATLEGELDLAAAAPSFDLHGSAAPTPWLAARGSAARVDALVFSLKGTPQTAALRATAALALPELSAIAVTLDAKRLPDTAAEGLRARLHWRLEPAAPLYGASLVAGGGELAWQRGRLELQQTLVAPSPVTLEAAIEPGPRPRVDARAAWQSLALVFGETTLRSPRGELRIDGVYPDLALELDARIDDERLGAVDARATARLGAQRLALTRLVATLLNGSLEASGELASFTPAIGSFELQAHGLDLASLREGLDTRLDAKAKLSLDGPRLRVALDEAAGRWRGQRLQGRGVFDLERGRARLEDVDLRIGRNRLALNGTIDEAFALDLRLEIPAAAELDASLGGALRGSGRLRGTPAAPVLDAELAATDLRAGDLRIATATLRAAVAPAASSNVVLDARELHAGDMLLGDVRAEASGTLEAYRVKLAAGAGGRHLDIEARGGWQARRLAGRLSALSLAWPELGRWTLRGETDYRYAEGAVSFTPLCLSRAEAKLCMDAEQLAREAGRVRVVLDRVPAALAQPWLPPRLRIDGTLAGELEAAHEAGGWRPRGAITGNGVVLVAQRPEAGETRLPISPLSLRFHETDEGRRFALEAASGTLGEVKLAGLLREAAEGTQLAAQLHVANRDLRALAEFVPALAGSEGGFALDASAQGPLKYPALNAHGRLVDGRLRIERAGITLDALALDARMHGAERIDLELELGQGEQRMEIAGQVRRAPDFPFALHVRSERFSVLRRAELDADVAPDLDVDGTLQAVRLRGKVALPLLSLRLQKLPPDAVAVSADEVLLDARGEPVVDAPADSAGLRFYRDRVTGEVELTLGEEARVSGLGLDSRLTGAIRFSKDAGSLGFADGRVSLKEGSYVAYRQKLDIEKGELLFAGPLDNPALDVLALRPDLAVKAGVTISGTVQAPIVRLYSVPAMADLETLSYVVTGEPLSGTNRTSADLLAKAALGLGLEHAAGLTDQLRDWFALDELGISGGSTVEDTSLVAGKRLSPRFRVRSEFNPFDRLWSVFLRYRLTPHLSVEGESGARQGADLIYSIEREDLF